MNRWRIRAINFFKRFFLLPRSRRRIYVLLGATLFALLAAEMVVRIFAFDWRLINKMLYFQMADRPSHQPDPNPDIIFRLKPGDYDYTGGPHGYRVHINAYGARGPEHPAKKPAGLFRILCFGGSNVYGAGLKDSTTWPVLLEKRLNRDEPGRYEVWNFGTSAYVPLQMATLAREKVELLQPDLVVFAISNGGAPAFLFGQSPAPLFDQNPEFWRRLLGSPHCLIGPQSWSVDARLMLIRWLRLYRLAAAYHAANQGCSWVYSGLHEIRNVNRSVEFYQWVQKRAHLCIFLYPGTIKKNFDYDPYYVALKVPALSLAEKGLPTEYYNVHPPEYVMVWYADRLAKFLREKGLLEPMN
jgi:hypothetical protein